MSQIQKSVAFKIHKPKISLALQAKNGQENSLKKKTKEELSMRPEKKMQLKHQYTYSKNEENQIDVLQIKFKVKFRK